MLGCREQWLPALVIMVFLFSTRAAVAECTVDGISLGMTAAKVVKRLGSSYNFVNLIEKSSTEGLDYALEYRKPAGSTEIHFIFGRAAFVSGGTFRDRAGHCLSRGDRAESISKLLGPPRDSDGESSVYTFGKTRVIFETKDGRIKTVMLEHGS